MKLKIPFIRISLLAVGMLTAGLSLPVAVSAAEGTTNFTGLWKNQRGSTLELQQDGNKLSGIFTTAVARTKACLGYGAPVMGFANDNALSVSLSMEGCGSPVSISQTGVLMTGDDGKEKIKIQALVQSKGEEAWDSQILVADYYHRIK